jgi:hypothetical protein
MVILHIHSSQEAITAIAATGPEMNQESNATQASSIKIWLAITAYGMNDLIWIYIYMVMVVASWW